LLKDLIDRGLWSDDLKQKIVARNGSVQDIDEIPADLKPLYKTAWELKQRTLIDMAAARGAFICQSQSLNLFISDPTYSKLTSMHFYTWKKGLKTGCYYLRTKAPVTAQKFTVDPRLLAAISNVGGKQTVRNTTINNNENISDDSDDESYVDSSDDEVEPIQQISETASEKKKRERAALMERLAKELEDEEKKGCVMCSS